MEKKLDRRARKTKAALLKELIVLLNEKDIKDISVKELSERADINRGTFYLHYSDVFDMLDKVEEELFEEFYEVFNHSRPDFDASKPLPLLLDLFHQIDKQRDLVQIFLGPHGDIAFLNRMTSFVSHYIADIWEANHGKITNLPYFNAFIVSGCVGLIKEWLNGEKQAVQKSPEEMAQLCSQIIFQTFEIFTE